MRTSVGVLSGRVEGPATDLRCGLWRRRRGGVAHSLTQPQYIRGNSLHTLPRKGG